ncbi:MAG: hypothetical protein ABF649_21420 [Bacillus sp. (in: firmicutes)]
MKKIGGCDDLKAACRIVDAGNNRSFCRKGLSWGWFSLIIVTGLTDFFSK